MEEGTTEEGEGIMEEGIIEGTPEEGEGAMEEGTTEEREGTMEEGLRLKGRLAIDAVFKAELKDEEETMFDREE
jgi:hypothetical protein